VGGGRESDKQPHSGHLDPGESQAIALAVEVHADVVLMDEQAGGRKPFAGA
jgi:predicted nucleic acid-binding protein